MQINNIENQIKYKSRFCFKLESNYKLNSIVPIISILWLNHALKKYFYLFVVDIADSISSFLKHAELLVLLCISLRLRGVFRVGDILIDDEYLDIATQRTSCLANKAVLRDFNLP